MKIFATLVFLLSLTAHAEETRWNLDSRGRAEAWIRHGEEGRIFLEHIAVEPGKLQTLLEHRAYDSPARAQAAFDELTRGYRSARGAAPRPGMVTEVTGEAVWPTRQEWTTAWEDKFSAWMRDEVDEQFMVRYGIATDCAEVAVSLRWIFARIHGLPAANHLMGTGELFGNESMREAWLTLPTGPRWDTDRRFRAALEYVMTHTFTHSIMTDFYPVRPDSVGIAPGTVMLHLYSEDTGHTEVVHWAGEGRPDAIQMIASTTPREVRPLPNYGIQDWGYPPVKGRDGLFRFRWPVLAGGARDLLPATQMPWYSLEQYDERFSTGYANFTDALIAHVVPHFTFDPKAALRARVGDTMLKLKARVKIVEDGFAICSRNHCAEGTPEWEAWSTPSRDAAIGRMFEAIDDIYYRTDCRSSCEAELDSRRSEILLQIDGVRYTLDDALAAWSNQQFSSDPNDPVTRRWGR